MKEVQKQKRSRDCEVEAIAKVQRVLNGLAPDARDRVLQYIHARHLDAHEKAAEVDA